MTETRARILDTAMALFYAHGVHAVGVNAIAARAAASKLSLYKYFQSKEHLVRAMLTEHSDRIHSWLERNTAQAPPGPGRVLAVFDLLIDWFAQPNYRGCAVVNTVTDTRADPAIAAIARTHLARYRGLLEDRLREAHVADPPVVARQLLLLIEGASVVTSIDGTPTAGNDARAAAARLVGLAGSVTSATAGPDRTADHRAPA
ncbi:MAG: TetR/AcrR family transcriptional regulator [Kutzneria sp.]|nr:TetR/AcrR family transcriptional regulator [Kutzneria sp.]MBV9846326.1 TetR/AcrR family transcriptional regulator [Kutzneria sp.]